MAARLRANGPMWGMRDEPGENGRTRKVGGTYHGQLPGTKDEPTYVNGRLLTDRGPVTLKPGDRVEGAQAGRLLADYPGDFEAVKDEIVTETPRGMAPADVKALMAQNQALEARLKALEAAQKA